MESGGKACWDNWGRIRMMFRFTRHVLPVLSLAAAIWLGPWEGTAAGTHHYLFIGHPRDDGPGEILQRDVERIDFSAFDLLLLGGDYTWRGTGTRETVAYLDAALDLAAPTTLAALGNHDTSNRDYFTDVTGRPRYYAVHTNGIAFVVLDTTDNGQDIQGGELQMLKDTVAGLSGSTHLILIHHHILWLADYPPLAELQGDPRIGASSATLSGLNFFDEVYPLLLQARSNGVEVVCLAGDRTGTETEEFFIDHTTADGIRLVAAGFKEELVPTLRTAVTLEHDLAAGALEVRFTHLSDLPRIPDESLIISELHYDPPPDPGNDHAFIELFNRGDAPYDLSGATFSSGVACTFPTPTVVAPGEYILVAADPVHYAGTGVRVFDYAGETKPDSDDPMWLRNHQGLEIDYVDYGVSDPWPSQPDNTGPSLMLIDPAMDNTSAGSWTVSDQFGGTPGAANIPPPRPGSFTVGGIEPQVSWHGVAAGAWYRMEFAPSLTPPAWRSTGSAAQATADTIQFSDPQGTGATGGFYRLSRQLP